MFERRMPSKKMVIVITLTFVFCGLVIMTPYLKYRLFYDKVELKCEKRIIKEKRPNNTDTFVLPKEEKVYSYYYDNEKYEIPSKEIEKEHISCDENDAVEIYAKKYEWKLVDSYKKYTFMSKVIFIVAAVYFMIYMPLAYIFESEELNPDYLKDDDE